jgi:hypothetical protein
MKRKKSTVAIVATAQLPIEMPLLKPVLPVQAKRGKCVICGDEVAPFSSEELCWVCRRLKISAWRESENQPSVQE